MGQKRHFPECRCVQRRAQLSRNSGLGGRVIFPYSKILKDREIILFQNRKNKIVGSTRFSMKINVFWWFFVANWTSKNQHAGLAMVTKAQFAHWILDEKSCYFRVFFVCFLSHCKTGVLIFSCYAQRRVLVHYDLPNRRWVFGCWPSEFGLRCAWNTLKCCA